MLGAIIGDMVGIGGSLTPTNDYNFEWLSEKNGFSAAATALPSHNYLKV